MLADCEFGRMPRPITSGNAMALTKDVIISQIQEIGFSNADARAALELILEEIKIHLEAGREVKISSFGRWQVKRKAARPGRNPYSGEGLTIAARRIVTFHPSDQLRDKIDRFFPDIAAAGDRLKGKRDGSAVARK